MISYIDKMREFRGGGQQAAMLETPKRKSNPLKVDRAYGKWRSLSADLTRYYESCILSKSAKRFQGARRKMYCASVAWRRAKESGRYSDYPGFTKRISTMAGKSRGKSAAAKRRKRDRFGRFLEPAARRVKKKRTSARENPISRAGAKKRGKKAAATRKRNKAKRSAAGRKGAAKRKRTAGRRSTPVRRKRRKSTRRVSRRRVSPRAIIIVKEKTPMRRKRRKSVVRRTRRRARRRSAAEETAENPISRTAAKKRGRKAAATRKRNKAKRRAAGRKSARKKTCVRRGVKRVAKRCRVKRGRRITVMVSAPRKRRRRTAKRRTAKRKRKYVRRTPKSHRLQAYNVSMENPLGSALENPLSGGEMALAFVTGGVGYVLGDLLDRYLATNKDATPSANSVQILSKPSVTRMAAQAGLTAVPMALAYWVRNPMARSALQGLGLGAGFHLVGQIIKTYVLGMLKTDNTPLLGEMGTQLYPDTISANSTAALSVPPSKTAGLPRNRLQGAPYGQLGRAYDVGPRATVGVGIDVVPGGGGMDVPPIFPAPGTVYSGSGTYPVPNNNNAGCMPCSAQTAHAAVVDAYNAARDEVGSGASGCGYLAGPSKNLKPSASFPD